MPNHEEKALDAAIVERKPWGAGWDTPAAGVPRRFGVSIMLMMTAMYAVLFATMQMLDAPPAVFLVVGVLVTGVGFGQMLLFGGRYPRAASIWVGLCLFPLEVLVVLLQSGLLAHIPLLYSLMATAFAMLPSALLGAMFGYLAGGLTAGAFLVIDMYARWRSRAGAAMSSPDPADDQD